MSEDLVKLIESLNTARALLGDEIYQAKLAELRATHGHVLDEILKAGAATSGGNTQIITGTPKIGAAVAGSVHGSIYINGQWTRDEATLVRRYLGRLITRYNTLPLQGIREQRSRTDVLAIKLDRVYTQLATENLVERERFDREILCNFEAEKYLNEHVGNHVLPAQRRLEVLLREYHDLQKLANDFLANTEVVGTEVIDGCTYQMRKLLKEQRPRQNEQNRTPVAVSQFSFRSEPSRGVSESHVSLYDLSPAKLSGYAQEYDVLTFRGQQLVSEAIASNNHLVLLGEPGSGKSTALRYLTLMMAEAGLHEHDDLQDRLQGWDTSGQHYRPLPIFYPLLSFAQRLMKDTSLAGTAHDLWNALADFIDSMSSATGLATVIRDRLDSDDVLLLLDGLDEVATVESRRKVVQAVQQFATEYPKCRIVVTCRVRAYEGDRNSAWQLAGWSTATLTDWTLAQIEHFVAAWYLEATAASNRSDDWRKNRVTALTDAVNRRPDLQRLGTRPLLLTIMALVHFNDGRLPEDSVSLYRRCIEILLGQWELGRADGTAYGTLMDYIGLPNSGVEALRPLLEVAAFRAHEAKTETDQGSLSCDTLRVLVMEALNERGHHNPFSGAERFLDYTDKRAGLLQASDASDTYTFPHLTFQEYLAGVHLTSGPDVVTKIMARRNEERWRIPIILGVGDHVSSNKLDMPFRLFHELLSGDDRPPEQAQRDLLFAADLGKELGWDRLEQGDKMFNQVRQGLARQLTNVVEGTILPAAERVCAGMHLGELGDLRPGVCTLPPAMIDISGGTFVIGYTQVELDRLSEEERKRLNRFLNEQSITLVPFAISKYPVTNAQYKLFMDDDGYNPVQPWWDAAARSWRIKQRDLHAPESWTHPHLGIARPNHPVVGITWYEAQAFCRWLTQHLHDGHTYRLPTEAEWEWTGRGTIRRTYPWGNVEPDDERANCYQTYNGTTAVGCFMHGATPEGVLDLAGNVREWTNSIYTSYLYDPDDSLELWSAATQENISVRGGSWMDGLPGLRTTNRFPGAPGKQYAIVGFRLVRQPAV